MDVRVLRSLENGVCYVKKIKGLSSYSPTPAPTKITLSPTLQPTYHITSIPTTQPTAVPTLQPTSSPTHSPTKYQPHLKGYIHPNHVRGDVAAALRKVAVVTPSLLKCLLLFYKKGYIADHPAVWLTPKQELLRKSKSLLAGDAVDLGITLRYGASDHAMLVRLENIEINGIVYILKSAGRSLTQLKAVQIASGCHGVRLVTIPPTSAPTTVPSSAGHGSDDDDDKDRW
jgi:hypothetical protein